MSNALRLQRAQGARQAAGASLFDHPALAAVVESVCDCGDVPNDTIHPSFASKLTLSYACRTLCDMVLTKRPE